MTRRVPIKIALAATAVGLLLIANAVILGMRLPQPTTSSPAAAVVGGVEGRPAAQGASATALLAERRTVLLDHALFHSDRKFTPPPVESTQVVIPPPDYAFVGYLGIPGKPGKAILKAHVGNKPIIVAAGADLGGWTVMSVTSNVVLLSMGEQTAELTRNTKTTKPGLPTQSQAKQTRAPSQNVIPPAKLPKPQQPPALMRPTTP